MSSDTDRTTSPTLTTPAGAPRIDRSPTTVEHPAPDAEVWSSLARKGVRKARRRWASILGLRLVILVVALGAWQLAGTHWIDPFYISTPSAVARRIGDWISDGTLATNLWATLHVMLEGFALGALGGTIVGFVLGLNRYAARVLDPFIQALYSIPKVALAPVFILWLGVGDDMRVVLTGTVVFFIVFWTAYAAVREVDAELIDVVKLMGGRRRHTVLKVVAPGALPGILHGFKISIPYALIGTIVAELLASSSGVGYLMQQSQNQYDTAGLFAGLIALMVMAVVLDAILAVADRYATRWRPEV